MVFADVEVADAGEVSAADDLVGDQLVPEGSTEFSRILGFLVVGRVGLVEVLLADSLEGGDYFDVGELS